MRLNKNKLDALTQDGNMDLPEELKGAVTYDPETESFFVNDDVVSGYHFRLRGFIRDFMITLLDGTNWTRDFDLIEELISDGKYDSQEDYDQNIEHLVEKGLLHVVQINNLTWLKLTETGASEAVKYREDKGEFVDPKKKKKEGKN